MGLDPVGRNALKLTRIAGHFSIALTRAAVWPTVERILAISGSSSHGPPGGGTIP
jgi:hypothetical protein